MRRVAIAPAAGRATVAIVVLSLALATVLGHMLTMRGARGAPN